MLDVRLKMFKEKRLRRDCAPSTSSISHHQSHIPSTSSIKHPISNIQGLTLIELLVVIVILTTLVGGVIPILSPNNDERKIQVASRGLQSYITLTQSQAARTGRSHGIAFRESSPESGVALEVFGWEVPPPFAGFSTESRVAVTAIFSGGFPEVYNPGANTNFKFHPLINGFPLYKVSFVLAGLPSIAADPLPPRMFRVGDTIDLGGNQFLVIDDGRNRTFMFAPSVIQYLDPTQNPSAYVNSLVCAWLNNDGQVAPQGLKRYQINRQPTTSSESPYQLPAGIVIDMQGSVTEGNTIGTRFPTFQSLYTNRTIPPVPNPIPTDTVGIMFSPTGAVDSVYFNDNKLTSVSRVTLLLGRIENGGINPTTVDFSDSTTLPWVVQSGEKFEDVQERVNWLNLDSRLLSIVTSNGRAVVSDPAFVNLAAGTDEDGDGNTIDIDADDQLEAAHQFAHEMTTAK